MKRLVQRLFGLERRDQRLEALEHQMDQVLRQLDTIANARVPDREAIIHKINYTNHNLYLHLSEANRKRELFYRDVMIAIDSIAKIYPAEGIDFITDTPLALDTDDFKMPWGTAQDNTRLPRFVAACERRFRRPLTFLDLGCSGGGLVLDFILRGHRAFGVEGSDYSLRALRAEWRVLPNNLLTADITKPFFLNERGTGEAILCDVISMWEVLEHIGTDDLPQLFANINRHLKGDGIFIGSVSHVTDDHPSGARYHRTVQSIEWWESKFKEHGLEMITDHGFRFEDFARGTSNGPIDENYSEQPGMGSHFVARRLG